LLEQGVIDAQALNFGSVNRLASKLGLAEIERARDEAHRIGEETGHAPPIFGRELVEIVRMARAAKRCTAPEGLAQQVEQKRAEIYSRMAATAGSIATKEAQSA